MLELIKSIYENPHLPEHNELHALLEQTVSSLESENSFYRPYSKLKGKTFGGGLLTFLEQSELPVIVVPDLHARQKFIVDLLSYSIPQNTPADCRGMTVWEALKEKKVYVVCLGDLFHSEGRCSDRWKKALKKAQKKEIESPEMTEEMTECLGLLEMLMLLKNEFIENFHILKGNHENVLNSCDKGNHPFYKFADEGNMVYDFLSSHYDDLIIQEIDWFENSLPLCAVFRNLVLSHAEPSRMYTKKEIINYHTDYDVVYGMTWTQNDFAENGSVEDTIKQLLPANLRKDAVWITGHRPVYEKYALRQGGHLIQIHNPNEENVAIVIPELKFNPDIDIYSVEP
ncbi:MAG: metallophosphoesterase [Treponema sp.]|nr:metallophosphoesterase [Treponema sp.]